VPLIYKYGSPLRNTRRSTPSLAPAEIQGDEGNPHKRPGIDIGEGLPRVAQIMDRLTVVRSLTHPYPLHTHGVRDDRNPDVDTKIESLPRHKRQWPFIGSLVDFVEERQSGRTASVMPRNIVLPFVMGSKNEIPPLAGLYGAMLGMRYDPVYTDFTPAGTRLAPEVRPGASPSVIAPTTS
jgi:hypothetical protein